MLHGQELYRTGASWESPCETVQWKKAEASVIPEFRRRERDQCWIFSAILQLHTFSKTVVSAEISEFLYYIKEERQILDKPCQEISFKHYGEFWMLTLFFCFNSTLKKHKPHISQVTNCKSQSLHPQMLRQQSCS